MDTVRFVLDVESFPVGEALTVGPYVNDVHLRDLAQAAERSFATADGQPDLAGSYAGLRIKTGVCWPSRHFLGEPRTTWFDDGDTVLLGCVCGDAGCWPLTAEVDVSRQVVTWRRFRTGHRSWDLSGLGPFQFDFAQYLSALRETRQE